MEEDQVYNGHNARGSSINTCPVALPFGSEKPLPQKAQGKKDRVEMHHRTGEESFTAHDSHWAALFDSEPGGVGDSRAGGSRASLHPGSMDRQRPSVVG